MHKTLLTVAIVLAVVALALAGYLFLYQRTAPVSVLIEESRKDRTPYSSSANGLSFDYSPSYYLKERNVGSTGRPLLSIVLVENTQENRDLVEGRSATPRDGPVSITIDVYPNPDELPAEDWVRADTNWTIRTSEAAPVGKGQITGVTYSWSGLYEGKSVVITEGAHTYAFSVTWLTPDDPILAEFDRVLESVRLTPQN